MAVKLNHPCTQFHRNVRLSPSIHHLFKQCEQTHKRANELKTRTSTNRDFFGASWLFWLLRWINTVTYLLTYLTVSFLLITINFFMTVLWNKTSKSRGWKVFLLLGFECYKDIQMKAEYITKLTTTWHIHCMALYKFSSSYHSLNGSSGSVNGDLQFLWG